jgi:hypothetical protein
MGRVRGTKGCGSLLTRKGKVGRLPSLLIGKEPRAASPQVPRKLSRVSWLLESLTIALQIDFCYEIGTTTFIGGCSG